MIQVPEVSGQKSSDGASDACGCEASVARILIMSIRLAAFWVLTSFADAEYEL
jgi:hypothetical protein